MKLTTIYTVYDRVTEQVVGDSFDKEVNKAILKPLGLHIEDKVDADQIRIPLAEEQSFHSAVAKLRWEPYLKKL